MDVRAAGQALRIDLRPDGEGWHVDVDAADLPRESAYLQVEARGAGVSLLVADAPDAPARSYDVMVERRGRGEFVVYVEGRPVPVVLPHLLPRSGDRTTAAGDRGGGMQRIVASIPGRIVKVLVRPGDVVQPRQPVIVVEAMKMQNELRATRAGTVIAVHASEGTLVETGAPLVEIGAAP